MMKTFKIEYFEPIQILLTCEEDLFKMLELLERGIKVHDDTSKMEEYSAFYHLIEYLRLIKGKTLLIK